jgi:hypothetical protein
MQKLDQLTRNCYKLHQVFGTRLHLGADIFSTSISILPLRLQIKMAIVIFTDFGNFRGIESGSIAAQYPVAAKCKARYTEWLLEEL